MATTKKKSTAKKSTAKKSTTRKSKASKPKVNKSVAVFAETSKEVADVEQSLGKLLGNDEINYQQKLKASRALDLVRQAKRVIS